MNPAGQLAMEEHKKQQAEARAIERRQRIDVMRIVQEHRTRGIYDTGIIYDEVRNIFGLTLGDNKIPKWVTLSLIKRFMSRLDGVFAASSIRLREIERGQDLATINRLLSTSVEKAEHSDRDAHWHTLRAVQLLERKAKLLGLDQDKAAAGTTVNVGGTTTITQNNVTLDATTIQKKIDDYTAAGIFADTAERAATIIDAESRLLPSGPAGDNLGEPVDTGEHAG